VLLERPHAPEPEQARQQRHQLLNVEIGRRTQAVRNEIDALPYRPSPLHQRVAEKLVRETGHANPSDGRAPTGYNQV